MKTVSVETTIARPREEVYARLADRLQWPFAKAYLRRQNGRALERLREQLEQAPGSRSP